jgi:serine/threonine protein kinase
MIDVGQTVGNYNITAKLGEGGMGVVFLAEHPVIGSKVALKAIHPHFARSADVVSRFVTEARAVNQIGHDHIVNITDFGHTPEGDFYFLMEYLQGEMLSEWINHHGAFPPARALNIAAQIADALQASHDQGVIHRDLKPDNIFLITRDTTADFVKVLDFGLAKLTHASVSTPTHNTGAGTVMGTPYYMSPEQCEGRAEVDHRADIYGLGVILFEMLTGRVPFGGEGYGEVIIKHVTVRPPTARSLVPEIPPALDAILSRALSKDPSARFQSMSQFREALLDPEVYAAAGPTPDAVEDDLSLSGRLRAALPTARTQMSLVAPIKAPSQAIREAPNKEPSQAPPPVRVLAAASSTFRHTAGEVVDDVELKPKRNRGGLVLLGVASLVGIAVVGMHGRGAGAQLVATARAAVRPSTIRVNFSSDPDGATVSRSDGSILGVTPLSIDVPYSDKAVDFHLSKDGYTTKISSVVPNLPLPVFALLEKIPDPTPVAALAPPIEDPPITDVPAARRTIATAHDNHHHHHSDVSNADNDDADDSDGVLAPSTP